MDTERLLEKDREYVWHPFTQMKCWVEGEEEQLIIERGDGIYLYDTEGNKYYDGVSSIWLNVHGHVKRELNQAIKEQLEKVAHTTMLGLANVPSTLLAEKLVEISPQGLNKVFYSDNGSTAVEAGLKMAYQYWRQLPGDYGLRDKYISLKRAYHGDTIGSVSVGGIDLFHSTYEPLLFQSLKAPSPYCYRCFCGSSRDKCEFDCVQEVEKIMQENEGEIAAFVLEPLVQGAGGMITAPEGYLLRISKLCEKYNVLLIVDEVATGFGRTGKMFACEHEGVEPDIMAVAKGITGGYLPLAATLTTDEVYNAFYGDFATQRKFFHGHSYTGNPLAAAVALANLELFEDEDVLGKAKSKIRKIEKELKKFASLPNVGDIRQCGFMLGIELVMDKKSRKLYPAGERMGMKVSGKARQEGLIIRPLGNVVVFMPPLSSTKKEIEEMLTILYESIRKVT